MNFSERSCKKCFILWKSTRNHRFCQHYLTFRTNYHVFAFRWTFKEKVGKSCSFREKARKIMDLDKTCNFSKKVPCFYVSMNFSANSCKKCLISWKSTKTHRFGQNYATFSNKLPCFGVSMNFSAKGCKSGSIPQKARKTIDLAKTCNFSSKLPCLGIFMNFPEKNFKRCLISWKSTRNHPFGQHYATFRTNYHVFAFRWTFKEMVGKKGSFREKARKIMDLDKSCNFSNKVPIFYVSMNFSAKNSKNCLILWKSTKTHGFCQSYATFCNKLPCFGVSMNLSTKGWKKRLNSWKSTKNYRFGKNFATFRTKYHVFAFPSTYKEKVVKSASFREKTRETIDFAKTCNFWSKLSCLGIFMNFSERSCKKCFISWKSTRNHRLGQHYLTFRTNYHVFAFRWTFKEKVGKSCSFREKARKIVDLDKTCNFSKKVPCFYVSMNFSANSCKNCLISWKSTKTHRFGQNYATSSNKLPCFRVLMNFSAKGCKSSSIPEEAPKTIDLAKTCNFSSKLRCLRISMNFPEKSCKNYLISWKNTKNHRFGQNWQCFEQTTMSWHFHELFRKKLQKVPHLVKRHVKSWILRKLATFRENYHVFTFRWTLSQKVAKPASFRGKARKLMDLAKTMQLFRTNYHVLVFR